MRFRIHGQWNTPAYHSWLAMISRCENPRNISYKNYGGRGIRVCDRWRRSAAAFLADIGPRPGRGYSLDRIDVNGHYEPGNARWATAVEQQRNQRTNRILTVNGEAKCLSEWAALLGITRSALRFRLDRGWSVEAAVSEPANPNRQFIPMTAEARSERARSAVCARWRRAKKGAR